MTILNLLTADGSDAPWSLAGTAGLVLDARRRRLVPITTLLAPGGVGTLARCRRATPAGPLEVRGLRRFPHRISTAPVLLLWLAAAGVMRPRPEAADADADKARGCCPVHNDAISAIRHIALRPVWPLTTT